MNYSNYLNESLPKTNLFSVKNDVDNLFCWQNARELRIAISTITKGFPEIEKHRLSDQLIRASRSVADNIAEGYGRYHFKDKQRFFFIARGSLIEVVNHLYTALDESYINQAQFEEMLILKNSVAQTLNGYIRYLSQQAHSEK